MKIIGQLQLTDDTQLTVLPYHSDRTLLLACAARRPLGLGGQLSPVLTLHQRCQTFRALHKELRPHLPALPESAVLVLGYVFARAVTS